MTESRLSVVERDLFLLKCLVGTNIALTLIVRASLVSAAARLLPLRALR